MEIKAKEFSVYIKHCFLGIALLGAMSCSSGEIKSIKIDSYLNLDELKPRFDLRSVLRWQNCFAADSEDNYYLLDTSNHRILKFNDKGQFLKQIGSIGNRTDELFNPVGIFIVKNELFVLNDGGKEVKSYSLEGDAKISFPIENAWLSDSLCVESDVISIGTRYKGDVSSRHGIVSLYHKDGHRLNDAGKPIRTHSQQAYALFNAVYITVRKDKIFIAFRYFPLIEIYDFKGMGLGRIDLNASMIPEIVSIKDLIEDLALDTPESHREEKPVRFAVFCAGFGVDERQRIYYAINIHQKQAQDHGAPDNCILHLDSSGKVLERIVLRIENKTVNVKNLYISSRQKKYALGFVNQKAILLNY